MARQSLLRALEVLPVSEVYRCHYLPGRLAQQQQFYWPEREKPIPGSLYQELMDQRFRRSGRLLYRPTCAGCNLCIPIRLVVGTFVASRSQRRVQRKNRDLHVVWGTPLYSEEKFALYEKYMRLRHGDDETQGECDPDQLRTFLYDSPTDTVEGCYYLGDQLIGVGLCDVTDAALSSVYFYFDPVHSKRSLGVFSALEEIALARARGLRFYYLGYWVPGCRKMEYKSTLGSHELLIDGVWQERE
jgi:arginine-tRNA-protein transferase